MPEIGKLTYCILMQWILPNQYDNSNLRMLMEAREFAARFTALLSQSCLVARLKAFFSSKSNYNRDIDYKEL